MNDEIKEILDELKAQDEEFTKAGIKEYPLYLRPDQQRILLDCITNLQEENERLRSMLMESIETTNKVIEIINKEIEGSN